MIDATTVDTFNLQFAFSCYVLQEQRHAAVTKVTAGNSEGAD